MAGASGESKEAVELLPLRIIEQTGMRLITDQHGMEWARVPVNGHLETLRLNGKPFRNFLVRHFLRQDKMPSKRLLSDTLTVLAAQAEGDRRELHNRSAWGEESGTLFIDLADQQWRAVRVQAGDWSVDSNPPPLFRRFAHQQPLPVPDRAGRIEEVFDYLPPLPLEGDRLLLLAWIVCGLVPMPRPILLLVGPQGSAKSTFTTFVRRLLDPSQVELLGRDARCDLPLIFQKHAVPAFDNMDALTPQEADLCCQAVTKRGIDRRKLYTDDDDFILSFQRAIIANGLHPPTSRPDFLDRALILELDRLPPERRELLGQLEAAFMAARPRLFGGLLNTLSRALALGPSVSAEGLSRMADFHRMGRAVAQILGHSTEAFDQAYRAAEARQRRGAFDNSLALAAYLLAREARRWQGTADELLRSLHETARKHRLRVSPECWPATSIGLGRQLKHLAEALGRYGIRLTKPRRSKERLIALEYDAAADASVDEE